MHRSRTLTYRVFQCSSASRKFLNRAYAISASGTHIGCFSALQRAENSSIGLVRERVRNRVNVSVLFSEPKIPQWKVRTDKQLIIQRFSALQRAENSSTNWRRRKRSSASRFSALQRAENSSTNPLTNRIISLMLFQCSSASRKFLNPGRTGRSV